MTDLAAISKVEDALAATLSAYAPLAGIAVVTDRSIAEAAALDSAREIVIYTTGYQTDQADEPGQTIHTATIEFVISSDQATVGIISRDNHAIVANIIGAIGADRSVGGRLQDIQELNVAGAAANGKDVSAVSIAFQATFFTSRSDWFHILGPGGQVF
jgi:hypothetical protein